MANYIKRLSVPRWVEWDLFDEDTYADPSYRILGSDRAPKIDPIFFRDGWYYDRRAKRTWLEVAGTAYAYNDVGMFKYELEFCFPHRLPRANIVRALLVLKREHSDLLSTRAAHELTVWKTWVEHRDIAISATRNCTRDRFLESSK